MQSVENLEHTVVLVPFSSISASVQSLQLVALTSLVHHVIYQTRETVFHRDIQTLRRELKIRRAAEYF